MLCFFDFSLAVGDRFDATAGGAVAGVDVVSPVPCVSEPHPPEAK
jgi:hypothetical protein